MVGGEYVRIEIPGELPDLNAIIDASKSHWASYRDFKEKHTNDVCVLAKRLPKMDRINLQINWYCKDKRKDKDNISVGIKFILDGLVKAGVIKNDGWKQIDGFTHNFYVDKENPRTEVLITKIGE